MTEINYIDGSIIINPQFEIGQKFYIIGNGAIKTGTITAYNIRIAQAPLASKVGIWRFIGSWFSYYWVKTIKENNASVYLEYCRRINPENIYSDKKESNILKHGDYWTIDNSRIYLSKEDLLEEFAKTST